MVEIKNKDVKKWIKDFKVKLNKQFSPKKIILFGSRARKDNLVYSDIDLVIVSDKFKNIKWPRRLGSVAKLWRGLIVLEPLCYTLEEFNEKRNQIGIVKRAVEEGMEL